MTKKKKPSQLGSVTGFGETSKLLVKLQLLASCKKVWRNGKVSIQAQVAAGFLLISREFLTHSLVLLPFLSTAGRQVERHNL